MKKLVTIILILILVSWQKITVLEVKNVDDVYKVSYSMKYISIHQVIQKDFYTIHGVDNFIIEMADRDVSGWGLKW